jgi:hypothetical protein
MRTDILGGIPFFSLAVRTVLCLIHATSEAHIEFCHQSFSASVRFSNAVPNHFQISLLVEQWVESVSGR